LPLSFTAAEELDTGDVHAVSPGAYKSKLMLPVGLTPPANVAVSLMVPPTVTAPEAVVPMAGVAALTMTDSPGALHSDTAPALLASPEYDASHR
jgi:hypothetical protein